MIKSIGDHAFDSCVSMDVFNCPRKLETVGKSAFQNCKSLKRFYFPTIVDVPTNKIEIGSYAFADCSELRRIYLEKNVDHIYKYAFVDCHPSLVINYTGSSAGDTSLTNRVDLYWRQRYIAKNRNNSSSPDTSTHN